MPRVLRAEFRKLKRSRTPLWTAFVVLASPLFSVSQIRLSGGAGPGATWALFMRSGIQNMSGAYGLVLFGLVGAYVFAREHRIYQKR